MSNAHLHPLDGGIVTKRPPVNSLFDLIVFYFIVIHQFNKIVISCHNCLIFSFLFSKPCKCIFLLISKHYVISYHCYWSVFLISYYNCDIMLHPLLLKLTTMQMMELKCCGASNLNWVLSVIWSLFGAIESDVQCTINKKTRSHFQFHDYIFIYLL